MKEAAAPGSPASASQRRLQFDRIVLLRNRVRMQDAVDLSESLLRDGIDVAPYAQAAAADAYLYLRQPEKARDLFLQAQSKGEIDFGAQVEGYRSDMTRTLSTPTPTPSSTNRRSRR